MGRRSEHSKEQLHAMALQAARDIVEREGLGQLSARKIAVKIGYTVGTLYLVFDNLDDLITQVNAQTLDELYSHLKQSFDRSPNSEQRIHALARAYIQFAQEHHHLWSAIFEHQLPKDVRVPDWFKTKVLENFALVERALAPYSGNNNPKQIQLASRALWSGIHGICVLGLGDQISVTGAGSIQALVDTLINNFLNGLKSC